MVEFSIREKEEQEYVDSIVDAVSWLGFGWRKEKGTDQAHAFFASDYFDFTYKAAERPDVGSKDFLEALNPDSLKTINVYVEPSLAQAKPDEKFQFERHGYFVADRVDHGNGKVVLNKITGLKDTWAK